MAVAVVDLPGSGLTDDGDGLPGKMSKLAPCSTSVTPSCVRNATVRSRTLSSGICAAARSFIDVPSPSGRGRL